ncbi:MAG: Glu/Leu/Phe/Val dehydrogenase dimerization domain-containing protein [Candidatus Paracaedibacter sp.]
MKISNKFLELNTQPLHIFHWKDKGKTEAEGWLVIDSVVNGVSGGGTFMHPNASLQEVKDLARSMTYKNNLQEISFGGGKAGIKFDPTKAEANSVLERFLTHYKKILEDLWCTGGDLNTTNEQINNIVKEKLNLASPFIRLAQMVKQHEHIEFKPDLFEKYLFAPMNPFFSMGEGMTGYILSCIIKHLCKDFLEKPLIAIQGFGKVGSSLAYFLYENNIAHVVGICEKDRYIYNPEGINIKELLIAKKMNKDFNITDSLNDEVNYTRIFNNKNPTYVLNEFLTDARADIFSPCAARYVINNLILSTLKWKTFSNQKMNKKFIISGSNNIFKNISIIDTCIKSDITVIPEWFSSSGTALFFLSILRQTGFSNTAIMEVKQSIRNRLVSFLEEASKALSTSTNKSLYETIYDTTLKNRKFYDINAIDFKMKYKINNV